MVAPPGFAVTVHAEVGKPLKATVAVATAQVGCVMVPIVGVAGNGLTITPAAAEVALSHDPEAGDIMTW